MGLSTFSIGQLEALRALQALWGPERFVLIGASALACFIEMRWRQTYDLDVSVSISADEYPAGLDRLSGWKRHPKFEHQWTAPGPVRVDVIPAGPELLEAGEFVWPESGFRMSLLGLRLAFENYHVLNLAEHLEAQVAPVHIVTVLKMVAYQNRPGEREKDLADLGYILEGFLDEDDERRFAPEVFELGLQFEETSAFYLGREIGAVVNAKERKAVSDFLWMARSGSDPNATQARMVRLGPLAWLKNPDILLRRLAVFERGFSPS